MSMVTQMATRRVSGFALAVCENVRAEAARKGFAQADIARKLGMTPNQVSRRWRGLVSWPLEELEQVAKALDVPIQGLLYTSRDSNPEPADSAPPQPVVSLAAYRRRSAAHLNRAIRATKV